MTFSFRFILILDKNFDLLFFPKAFIHSVFLPNKIILIKTVRQKLGTEFIDEEGEYDKTLRMLSISFMLINARALSR